jgi:hypothetical protein
MRRTSTSKAEITSCNELWIQQGKQLTSNSRIVGMPQRPSDSCAERC